MESIKPFIHEYMLQKKMLYSLLLDFLNEENDQTDGYLYLIDFFENDQQYKNREELRLFLRLIIKISKNYHRSQDLLLKIQKILLYFANDIKKMFTNEEIFNLFQNHQLLLIFLIEQKIIKNDEIIANKLYRKSKTKHENYKYYFYPEIKDFINEELQESIKNELLNKNPNIFDNFEINRQDGENDSYICQLIRKDNVKDFITYVNQLNILLSTKIKSSIFETNPFLIDKNPTLIEYAAFFGSIQIFQYIRLNNVDLSSSLWVYATYGKNPSIIHILENDHISPKHNSYNKCFEVSFKCHHNDFVNYFENILIENKTIPNLNEVIIQYAFRFYNFELIPDDFMDFSLSFYFSCQYDYYSLVNIYLKDKDFNIMRKIVLYGLFYRILFIFHRIQ